jgi:hypothetical protein
MVSIEPDNVIMLAGAGASVHLGLPTLDDLLQQAVLGNDDSAERIRKTKNSIEAAPKRYKTAVFEELIAKIRYYLKATFMFRTDPTYREEVNNVPHDIVNGITEMKWKKALSKCYRVLIEEYGPAKIKVDSEPFSVTLKLFREISKLNKSKNLHIFTTNYDCSYQVLASNTNQVNFLSHIDNTNGRFKDQWFSTQKVLEAQRLSKIYVHRLHGCVAWFTSSVNDDGLWDGGGIIEEVYGAGKLLEIQDDDKLNNMCIKLIAKQLIGTNLVFSTAFEEFYERLTRAKILFVWGYSFRDLEVLRQINEVLLSANSSLKILYMDPYLTEENVVSNIRSTFHTIPIQVSPLFCPTKIDWRPAQGYGELIKSIVTSIEKGVKNG